MLLLHFSSGQLITTAAAGLEEEVRQAVRIPVGPGFAGRIAAEHRPGRLLPAGCPDLPPAGCCPGLTGTRPGRWRRCSSSPRPGRWVIVSIATGFPARWETIFQTVVTALILVMVFVIQHAQVRDQRATQRKLDEILLVMPDTANALLTLEHASDELHATASQHRSIC